MSYQRSQLSLAWRIIISSAPLSRVHRSAAPCRALPVPCRAVRYCAMLYGCSVLRGAACFFLCFSCMPSIIRGAIPTVLLLFVPGTTTMNHKKNALTAQLSPQLRIAQQRSAAPCGAVPCPAVLCRAALSYEHTAVPGIMRYQLPTNMYVRVVPTRATADPVYQLRGLPLVGSECFRPQCNSSFAITWGSAMPSAKDLPVRISRAHKKRRQYSGTP